MVDQVYQDLKVTGNSKNSYVVPSPKKSTPGKVLFQNVLLMMVYDVSDFIQDKNSQALVNAGTKYRVR
jgi:hypothetical protein